jgi:hypothetical protein
MCERLCTLSVEDGRRVVWKLPVYNTVRGLLTNPVYGGAYAFGRTANSPPAERHRCRAFGQPRCPRPEDPKSW